MKITDETRIFRGQSRITSKEVLEVSSNHYGTHEIPSVNLSITAPDFEGMATFGTDDPEEIKEIIEHMAKMAGLEVTITERFNPKYQPGDRVRSLMEDTKGRIGTVLSDMEDPDGWNVSVRLDGETEHGLFMHDELEPVTKNV